MSEWRNGDNSRREIASRPPDLVIGEVAARHHGCVGDAQLHAIGQSQRQIQYRVRVGRLVRLLPGVYSVGGAPPGRLGRLSAAALWAGPESFVSHRSAAALWGLLPFTATVHLSSPRRLSRQPWITVHRRTLAGDEVTERDGIPVTGLCRTLLDLAAGEGPAVLARALREAEYLRLADRYPLAELIERHPGERGTAIAAKVLGERRPTGHTESELEDAFLDFLADRDIEPPVLNAPITLGLRRIRVDCLWPDQRVVIELDGRRAHMTEDRFESDRRRDMALLGAGYAPGRVTSRRLRDEADELEADLRRLLDRRPRHASPRSRRSLPEAREEI